MRIFKAYGGIEGGRGGGKETNKTIVLTGNKRLTVTAVTSSNTAMTQKVIML